jgi:hypothetical protein
VGTNIYDAAVWQIAVVLGQVNHGFDNPSKQDANALATNQNRLLKEGYSGNALDARNDANRAITARNQFTYNGHAITDGKQAYSFRMISRAWLSADPFVGTRYGSLITAKGLPQGNANYQAGRITWTDWKPITGENAWAFLLGPLHAAYLHYVKGERKECVPFNDLSVQSALNVLPTFAAMQSPIGGVYYVPSGTLSNQGDQLVNPYQVSVENNASLYAGLNVLQSTLRAELKNDKGLSKVDITKIGAALTIINTMINGGQVGNNKPTAGLLSFFKNDAWRDNEFVQGGLANELNQKTEWLPALKPKAIDANTWGIAALGAKQIDQWFGFGAAYKNWQQVKGWGAYGVKNKLWGVGFSDEDGNGMNGANYRHGILSSEWTAGAINLVRNLIDHYGSVPTDSADHAKSQIFVRSLKEDEKDMLESLPMLRADNYDSANFPGKPSNYKSLRFPTSKSYLYASKRYLVPFGWYANPVPSTCATAWVILLADRFDPFNYGGGMN